MVTVDLSTLRDRLDLNDAVIDDAELESIRDACAATQAADLEVPDVPGPDLVRALVRRVGREVAARGMPLGTGSSEFGTTYVPRHDTILRTLEAPYLAGGFA